MDPDVSYEVQVVARAVDIPARRLEGWLERGVVVPTVRARGTGTRTRFTRRDVLRVAIIAEIQRLFGTDFRPGSISAAIGRDPLVQPGLDTVLAQAITHDDASGRQRSDSRAETTAKLWLYVRQDGAKRPSIGATRTPDEIRKKAPVLLLIDPTELWRRIQSRLEA